MKQRKDHLIINDKIVGRFAGPFHLVNDRPLLRFEEGDNEDEVRFWIGDTPAGHVWHTGHPTSLFYYQLSAGKASVLPTDLEEWEALVQTAPLEELPLERLFEPFKRLLPEGEYWLVYTYPQKLKLGSFNVEPVGFVMLPEAVPYWDDSDPPTAYFEFTTYFETRNIKSLNPDRIQHYQTAIQNGQSPVIVSYSRLIGNAYEGIDEFSLIYDIIDETNPYFILDGHHKARAYESLNHAARENGEKYRRVPGILHICKWNK